MAVFLYVSYTLNYEIKNSLFSTKKLLIWQSYNFSCQMSDLLLNLRDFSYFAAIQLLLPKKRYLGFRNLECIAGLTLTYRDVTKNFTFSTFGHHRCNP